MAKLYYSRIRSERLEQARPRPWDKNYFGAEPPLIEETGWAGAPFTWRFEFAAAISSSRVLLDSLFCPPSAFHQAAPPLIETGIFFACPHNNPSHSTPKKVYFFQTVPRPRDQDSEAVRSSWSQQFVSLSISVLSWHVFRFPCCKRVCEVAWVQIKSASWIPWAVSVKVHLKLFFCFGKFKIALPWMRERS